MSSLPQSAAGPEAGRPEAREPDDDTDRVLDEVAARVNTARPVDPQHTPFTGLEGPVESPVPDRAPDRDLESLFLRQETRRHAIDARLSIPLFGRRYYLVILGGSEKRREDRRSRDRDRHPLLTLGNVLFLGGVVAAVYALALVAVLAFNGIAAGL